MNARKCFLVGTLLIGIFTLYSSLAPTASAITYYACKNNSDGTIKIVDQETPCKRNETKISWDDGTSPGITVVLDNRWSTVSTHLAPNWSTVPASVEVATTQGGPLLILMNLSLSGGGHAVCQPIIDDQWAGDYSAQAKPSGPLWVEGIQVVAGAGGGWHKWTASRLYTGVPSGNHTFAIQCTTESGLLGMNAGVNSVWSSWTVLELR